MKKIKVGILVSCIVLASIGLGVFLAFKDCHKVTYVLHGGEGVKTHELVWENKTVKLSTPTKYGYKFTGWENKYGEVVETLENVTENITLHASWELDPKFYGDLPVIEVNTKYGTIPDSKEDYVSATLNMFNCQDNSHNIEDASIGIRLRGNTTRKFSKKPYRIKFDKKTSVFGLEENKSWVLLADYLDQSSIRNYAAFNMAQQMDNLTFANSTHHVVLTLNGEYKGLYLFTEQIDEKEGRTGVEPDEDIDISVDTSFPFLVEMDRRALEEGVTGVDNFDTPFYPCEIKYPEADERNIPDGQHDVVFDYIKEYVNAAFTALKTGEAVDVSFNANPMRFHELVEVNSFVEFWLVNELMQNRDSLWGSVYMSKTKTGKLTFGPVWDFDWSMSSTYTGKPYAFTEMELASKPYLLTNGSMLDWFIKDKNNYDLVCDIWQNVKDRVADVCNELEMYKGRILPIAQRDAEYWYRDTFTSKFIMTPADQVDCQYDYVVEFLVKRTQYLTETLIKENYDKIAK